MSPRPPGRRTPAANVHPLLEQAVGLHQAGRIAEAAGIYEKIIAQAPDHFDATHLLGVIALQEGRLEQARSLIAAALRIDPNDTAALNNLGTVHLRNRELEVAHKHFERAVKLQPNSSSGLTNLGTVLRELGRPREALVPLRRAHSGDPKSAIVCNLLGACLLETGDAHAAVELFEAATLAEPDNADGWGNLAVALNSTGEHSRAQECAVKAVAMRPHSSAAVAVLAAVEFEQGQIETAIARYREAIALPEPSVQTHCAYANALWTSGRCEEALEQLRQALAIDGNNAVARWKLAMSQCRTFYGTEGDIERSRQAFSQCLGDLQAWFHAVRRPEAYAAVGTTQPFFIAYQPFNNRDLLSHYGKVCSEWMASMVLDSPEAQTTRPQSPGEPTAKGNKIRVGIASAHIRDHSVWNAITKGWIRHLDKSRFEVWLYQLGRTTDEETVRARGDVDRFEDRPKNLQAWVKTIREANLDVLIYPEIGMDALTTQLASVRLAPVQAAAWGHAETSGLPTMDFYISADGLEPVNAQENYSERLVRLPNLGVCVEPLAPSITVPDLRPLGLPDDEPLLLCPGTPFKYSPVHDHVWARIAKGLRADSGRRGWARIAGRLRRRSRGRLVFFRSGNKSMDELLAQRLRRAFDREQVDFDAHVCLVPYLDRPRFFGLMQHAALMLDTVGFSGFNNALQAIETGLPVLANEGDFMRGRLASGIMRRMDLPELVASTNEDFIRTAIRLASDASACRELRVKIAERRGILFRDVEPVRALERFLIEAVGRF
ncbi:MAG TPA: tetratricopeptide repeat protein [Steroidobacteraceae bacterium]|nr:tetratricopeptide repeat protein [Steroidobacteraceae bacterium]